MAGHIISIGKGSGMNKELGVVTLGVLIKRLSTKTARSILGLGKYFQGGPTNHPQF